MKYLKIAGLTGGTGHRMYPGRFECDDFLVTDGRTPEDGFWLITLIKDDAHTESIRTLHQSGKSVPNLSLADESGYELVFQDVRCSAVEYRGRDERGVWQRYDFIAKRRIS